jgi:predicted 3-demethylubiquinone-9 3-methyltransferase (glyoxalase superfamily)
MQKISPFLWFDGQAEEAAKFYVSIFKNSKILKTTRYAEEAAEKTGRPKGSVMTVEFTLDGQTFVALNGGPGPESPETSSASQPRKLSGQFKFNESVSFVVNCETQDEVDYFWEKLTADGGEPGVCSWLKDKYGLSWQVQPRLLIQLLADPDKAKAERVMNAMMEMDKIDIAALKRAAEQTKKTE